MRRRWRQGTRALTRVVLGWLAVLLIAGTVTVALPTPNALAVQTAEMTCYTIADEPTTDRLVSLNVQEHDNGTSPYTTSNETRIGTTPFLDDRNIEALALRKDGTTLTVYAVEHNRGGNGTEEATLGDSDDFGQLGTIDIGNGTFSAGARAQIAVLDNYAVVLAGTDTTYGTSDDTTGPPPADADGQPPFANFGIADIDGLTFDPFTGKLWAAVRIDGSQPEPNNDYLVILDPATGQVVPDQFRDDTGALRDAIPVLATTSDNTFNALVKDVDDVAIDPATGILYGVANNTNNQDRTVRIDKTTGRATDVGALTVGDMEGLGFSNVGGLFGEFFGTTGNASTTTVSGGDDDDKMWRIDTGSGAVAGNPLPLHAFDQTNSGADYEAMDCLTSDTVVRRIEGYVYEDRDKSTYYATDTTPADVPYQNASVQLYIDNGTTADQWDAGDTFVDNAITNSNGFYRFEVSFPTGTTPVPRDFVMRLNTATLPAGFILTDNDHEEASFSASPNFSSTDTGSTAGNQGGPNTVNDNNVNNNFGFITAPDITKTASNVTSPGNGVLPGTDVIEYQIQLVNGSSTEIGGPITVTDTLSTGLTYAGTADGNAITVGGGGGGNELTVSVSADDGDISAVYTGNGEFQSNNALGLSVSNLDAGATLTITFRVNTANTVTGSTIANTACRNYTNDVCSTTTTSVVGSIGNFVWNDTNQDGVQDGGEAGIDGAVLALYNDSDTDCSNGHTGTATTAGGLTNPVTTASGGAYLFTRVPGGNYCVDVTTEPSGMQFTGPDAPKHSKPHQVTMNVSGTGRIYEDADFGYAAAASPPPPSSPPPADPDIIDLELTKSVNPQVANLGDEVTWTITLTNASPGATDPATGVTVQDDLPDGVSFVSATPSKGTYDEATGVWDVGGMAIDEVQTLEIVVTVDEPGFHTNIAYVTKANQTDIDSQPGPPKARFQDDEDNATVKAAVVDLELIKDVSDPTVVEGQEFTFDITVEHADIADVDPITATNVQVGDTVPDGLQVLRVSSSKGTFDTRTFIWFVGDLEVNESATLTLFVIAERPGTFVNVAQVVHCDQTDIDSTPNNGEPDEDDQDDATVTMTIIAALGDYVWFDNNGDGIQDAEEIGIPGVTIAIAGPFHGQPNPGRVQASAIVKTDDFGRYMFESLAPGLYIVVIAEDTLPGQLARTTSTNSYEVQLIGGTTYLDADFGYQPAAAPPEPEPGLPVTGSESDKLAIAGFSMLSWGALMILWTARRQPQPAHAAYRRRRRSPGNRRDPLKVDVVRPPGRRRWWRGWNERV